MRWRPICSTCPTSTALKASTGRAASGRRVKAGPADAVEDVQPQRAEGRGQRAYGALVTKNLAAIYFGHIHAQPDVMSTSTVFTNNRSQAVRLPADARLPPHVKRVEVRVHGVERIITPAGHTWDSFFMPDTLQASDDFLPQRATQSQAAREPL